MLCDPFDERRQEWLITHVAARMFSLFLQPVLQEDF